MSSRNTREYDTRLDHGRSRGGAAAGEKKKYRDPLGLANALFKPDNFGKDLKLTLLKLSNQIKNQKIFP